MAVIIRPPATPGGIGAIPATEKAAAGGVATLDNAAKVPAAQLPEISLIDTHVVADQAAMLALTAQRGDLAVRTDVARTFILRGNNPAVLGDWQELPIPAAQCYVSPTQPAGATGLYLWVQTGLGDSGEDFTFWIEDGS